MKNVTNENSIYITIRECASVADDPYHFKMYSTSKVLFISRQVVIRQNIYIQIYNRRIQVVNEKEII